MDERGEDVRGEPASPGTAGQAMRCPRVCGTVLGTGDAHLQAAEGNDPFQISQKALGRRRLSPREHEGLPSAMLGCLE